MKRLTTMIPFIRIEAGAFLLIRVLQHLIVDIKGDDRACLVCEVFYQAKDQAPVLDDMVSALSKFTPQQVLIAYGKAFEDAVPIPIKGYPVLAVRYGGRKPIGGGKTFNQWDIAQLELTPEELKTIPAVSSVAIQGKNTKPEPDKSGKK